MRVPNRPAPPGQASIEYVGLLCLVGIVLGFATTGVAGPDLAGSVQRAIRDGLCRVSGGICTANDARAADAEPCAMHVRDSAERLRMTIATVRGSRGDAMTIERRSDGSVRVSFIDGWTGGAEASLGVRFGALGATGSIAAGVSYQGGRVWHFDDPADAERFVGRWAARERLSGEARAALPLTENAEPSEQPYATYTEGGFFGEAEADALVPAGGRDLEARASAEGLAVLGRRRQDQDTTWYLRVEGRVAARLGLVLGAMGGEAMPQAVLEYETRAGRPRSATLRMVAGAGGELTLGASASDPAVLGRRVREATASASVTARGGVLLDAAVTLDLTDPANLAAVRGVMRPAVLLDGGEAVHRLAERLDADGDVALEMHRTTSRRDSTGASTGAGPGIGIEHESVERTRELVGAWFVEGGGALRDRDDCTVAPGGRAALAYPLLTTRRGRRPATMAAMPAASRTSPTTPVPMPAPSSHGSLAPARTSAWTPRLPSAFMTTTAQRPSWTSQVIARVPGPWAEATQKDRSPGAASGAPPGRSV